VRQHRPADVPAGLPHHSEQQATAEQRGQRARVQQREQSARQVRAAQVIPGDALARARGAEAAWLALGLGAGAAGPLVFVGGFVPRAVRWLAPAARPRALLGASAAAGGATVAAIDAVPRLLVGGYDFPFAVPAALLAIPIFVGWNRARLRREAGPKGLAFEALELAAIALATLAGAALAAQLAAVIRVAT
jgi:hypothetical protein